MKLLKDFSFSTTTSKALLEHTQYMFLRKIFQRRILEILIEVRSFDKTEIMFFHHARYGSGAIIGFPDEFLDLFEENRFT